MTLPTASEITELFLFGDQGKPADLLDANIVRPTNPPLGSDFFTSKNVARSEIMAEDGPGRFAVGALFDVVQLFFSVTTSSLAAGIYTKEMLFAEFDLTELAQKGLILQQASYDDGSPDYAERTYVFNTMLFEVQDGAEFVVTSTGERYINNYVISPSDDFQDNFDFDGGFLANIANNYLEHNVDPSGIGRTVGINYTGVLLGKTYNLADYQADAQKVSGWSFSPLDLANDVNQILDSMFTSGITSFIHDGKAVVFGSAEGEPLNVEAHINSYHVEAANNNGILFVGANVSDEANAINSVRDITFRGFGGDDSFIGGYGDDRFDGGEGNDTAVGAAGDDEYFYTLDNTDISPVDSTTRLHLTINSNGDSGAIVKAFH